MKKFFVRVSAFLLIFAAAPVPVRAEERSFSLGHVADRELAGALESALGAWKGVRDYEATFVKRERDGAALGTAERIFFKFEKPFKLFMRWLDSNKEGLQIVYERGKRDNKLAVHKPGLVLGLLPVVMLDQSSPWVREGSKSFDIEDAGIGTFLNGFARMVERGSTEGKISVLGRREEGNAVLFDVDFPGAEKDGDYFARRIVAGFDRRTALPLHMELYDWDGTAIGIYDYEDVKLNVGADQAFKKRMNGHLFRLYAAPARAERAASKSSNFAR